MDSCTGLFCVRPLSRTNALTPVSGYEQCTRIPVEHAGQCASATFAAGDGGESKTVPIRLDAERVEVGGIGIPIRYYDGAIWIDRGHVDIKIDIILLVLRHCCVRFVYDCGEIVIRMLA